MSDQKITTEIILAEFVPPPVRTSQIVTAIDQAVKSGNESALIQIIQMTHQALAAQQNQIDQIANFQQNQSHELSQIRQEIRQLSQTQPQQPQIVYNISDNRKLNCTQTTSYENCWNDNSDHSDRSRHTDDNSCGNAAPWWLLIPFVFIVGIWSCPNAQQQQQNTQPIERIQ